MKRIIPLILALLLLAACGAGVAEATPTPEPTPVPTPEAGDSATPSDMMTPMPSVEETPEPWPEFVAGPAEGGDEFCSEELGLSFTVPAEVSQKVAVSAGVKYYDPDGTSITLYYVPENGRYPITMFYMVAESPRGDFFRPGSWYYSTTTGHPIAAMS